MRLLEEEHEAMARVLRRLERTERRLDRTELLLEAVVRVVRDRNLVSEEAIRELIAQIDLEDGVEDGRIGQDRSARAPKCHSCGRPVNPRRTQCVYCHVELPRKNRARKGSPYR